MRTYIIICGFADVVAGGPIYYANKIRYMESLGWRVVVIPTNAGKRVLIRGMERFLGPYVPFILDVPSEYSKRQQRKLVDYLESFVPKDRGETVIETGTDYTNYWGEALAERIGAKHIVIFLDEQNERVDQKVIDFYKFKYSRHEMSSISKEVMQHFFQNYIPISIDDCIGLPCYCNNSIEDYDHPLIQQISRADYNIGYVGRLEKPFVPPILDAFISFATKYSSKQIQFVLFGGAFEDKTIETIKERFDKLQNVKLVITGYLFPLPVKALEKMDSFVSGAGSANAICKAALTSIKVDMFTYEALGIVLDSKDQDQHFATCPHGSTILDYLEWVLIDGYRPQGLTPLYQNDWAEIEQGFQTHIDFMNNTAKEKAYYDVDKLGISNKRRWKRRFRTLLGLPLYNALHNAEAAFLRYKASLMPKQQ